MVGPPYTGSDEKESKSSIWHRKFGHLGMQGLQEPVKGKMVTGLDISSKSELTSCESCVQGKSHRLPFQQSSVKRTSDPLELIHSDVCGKVGTQSLGNGDYFDNFLNDHTRCAWVYILKQKREVFQQFQEWKALVEKSSGRKIKIFRTDNGGEYTSTEFSTYLIQEGIKQELTTPHTPQQNEAAERLNRTLIEWVRTMLADSKLPHRFWAEALSTYVYLKNQSPTKALDGVTPYEAWSGIKPDVSILRIFGCSAYPHVPKIERKKLDIKTRKCVLLSYGTNQKGYHLFDVKRKKIVHSRDVVFDETSLPDIEKETIIKYVELEVSEEPIVESTTTYGETEEMTVNDQQTREPLPTSPNVSKEFPRRSTRLKQPPNRFDHSVIVALDDEKDPSTFSEAKSVPNKLKWEEAMKREMESLWSNEVWELVDSPPNRRLWEVNGSSSVN